MNFVKIIIGMLVLSLLFATVEIGFGNEQSKKLFAHTRIYGEGDGGEGDM